MSFQSQFVEMVLAEVDAAVLKLGTPGAVTAREFATAEEARDDFRSLLMAELSERFGGSAVATVTVPVVRAAAAASPAEKKKRGPMSDEKKAAMKAKRDATIAAKAGSAPASPADAPVAAPVVAPAASAADSPKRKRAPMSDEAKANMKAKRAATVAAKKGVETITDKLQDLTVEDKPNLPKVDATWRKHLKAAAKAQKVEATKEMEASLVGYLNSMPKDIFNSKKAEEHVVAFLAAPPAAAVVVETQPTDVEIVEFEGKDYYVNPKTKRVYEGEGEYDPETSAWTSYKAVGYAGMAAFATMELE